MNRYLESLEGAVASVSVTYSFRKANLTDLDFIYEQVMDGVENGHYSGHFLDPFVCRGLRHNLHAILDDGYRLDADQPAYGMILQQGRQRIGYVVNSSTYDKPGVEIWLMGVAPTYRGCGYGSAILDEVLWQMSDDNGRLWVRCRPASDIMLNMVKRRGFILQKTAEDGTQSLLKEPDCGIS